MDYEKKYEKLVDAVKVLRDNNPSDEGIQNWVNDNVPELIQNEDESIRKALLTGLIDCRDAPDLGWSDFGGIPIDDCIDWLEKQNKDGKKWIYEDVYLKEKEQLYQDGVDDVLENPHKYGLEKQGEKPSGKVEPKFKVGYWVVDKEGKEVFNISKNLANTYEIIDIEGNDYYVPHYTLEEEYDLWTIQDAKDGDVLKEDSCTFIVKRMKTDGTAIIHCCLFDDGDFDSGSTLCFDVDSTYPATKEQRDLLFQKMKEAGYEWDADKKELNLLITNGGDFFESENCEQKPTWGEDDELYLEDAIHAAKELYDANCGGDELVGWLKSLKDRVQPQPQKEWSEEDERMRKASIRACQYMVENFENSTWDYEDAIDWLNSLKNCVQPQWKPSSEYIAALEYQVNSTYEGSWQYKASKELLEQLKKL